MTRQRLSASACLFTLIVVMASGLLATQPSHAATPGIYIVLGDSIAAGIGSSLPRERGNAAIVTDWLTRLTGETVPNANLAIPGETAETFMNGGQFQRFSDEVARAEAAEVPIAAVSVSLGGNELLSLEDSGLIDRQAGLDRFGQSFGTAIAAIRSAIGPEAPLILTNVYDLTEGDPSIQSTDSWWIEQFNLVIETVAVDNNALVADVADRFEGRIEELTHTPFDVHPNNAGHRVIAQSIWSRLQLDTEPPTIDAPTTVVATRTTPTISFSVADNVAVAAVNVTSDDLSFRGAYETDENHYAILLDLGNAQASDVALTIEISDDSGNVGRTVVTIEIE